MTKKIYTKAIVVGRATTIMVGLAVILALTVGLASTALGANGQPWILGQGNVATAITFLGGPQGVDGPMARITNNNAGSGDTALDLRVQEGEAPMSVNSQAKVTNLNADKLDNLDASAFVRSVYTRSESTTGVPTSGDQQLETVFCDDADDFALSGGYSGVDAGTEITASLANVIGDNPEGWVVRWRNDATVDTISVMVVCADIGTPNQ